MAGKLSEATGSLAAGAERLEKIVRAVKERQLSEIQNAPVAKPMTDAFSLSPEEIWSKKYMTAGIGPAEIKPSGHPLPSTSFKPSQEPFSQPKMQQAFVSSAANSVKPSSIGQTLAKPARRRSWLGRLVRGS